MLALMLRRALVNHVVLAVFGTLTPIAVGACGATSTPPPTPTASASVMSAKVPVIAVSMNATPMPTSVAPVLPPPPAPEPTPSQAVIDAANRAKSEITSLPSELQGKPTRECSADACIWNFGFAAPGKDRQVGVFGMIGIDEKSLAATFHTENGDPLPISVYVTLSKREAAVVKAAATIAEVKSMCAQSSRQGAPCAIYSDRMPSKAPCPANPAPTDECLWAVYVGSNMGSHVSRLATVYVEPVGAKAIGIADLACPPISPAAFRAREVRRAAKTPDDDHFCD